MLTTETLALNNSVERINLNVEDLDADRRSYLPKIIDSAYVEIKHVKAVYLDSSHLAVDALDQQDRSPLQLLELIYNQKIVSSSNFHVFPHTSFLKKTDEGANVQQLQGKVIKDGLSKAVRIREEESNGSVGLMLLANVAKSTFFPETTLLGYLLTRYGCRDVRDLERCSSKFLAELKKLTLITTHLAKNRIFICDGIDDRQARQRVFSMDTRDENGIVIKKRQVSVVEYFETKYKQRIECGYIFPAFITTCAIETEIVGGQRVPMKKMEQQFQDVVKRNCKLGPDMTKQKTEEMLKQSFLGPSNPYTRTGRFELPVESSGIVSNAQLLHPPAIKFANNVREEPDRDGKLAWRPPNHRRFIEGGSVRTWMAVNYNRAIKDDFFKQFLEKLTRGLQNRGTNIPSRYEYISTNRFEDVAREAKQRRAEFIMLVTRDKMDPVHNELKLFEIESRIVTQHLWQGTVFNVACKNQQQTLENIMMKTNEKLGGVNFSIGTSAEFNRANLHLQNLLENKLISPGNMFIGVDAAQSGPNIDQEDKTVVGLVYTYNDNFALSSSTFTQERGQTAVTKLREELEKPILKYKLETRRWSSRIFIYRSGVTEGEFLYVATLEKKAITECFINIARRYPDFKNPAFILITGQRNNGLRFVPNNLPQPNGQVKDVDRNLKPGTCIVKGIANPMLEQFALIPHRALQGTARPTLFTVLADVSSDGKRVPSDELKHLTYSLCHLHGDVFGSVNTPFVLYHAAAVAKRGRNNMKLLMRTTGLNPQMEDYIEKLSSKLCTTLDNKYWA
ncbi:hypothetical protein M3Y97_00536500 [Aphelenchoides bicaudatus]|nr:hypothetical protein M3Y97_00536500 [Aphelenchoides bicaudatus]